MQFVVAFAAHQRVILTATVEQVIAFAADQQVVVPVAAQGVVAGAAVKLVIALTAREAVIALTAQQRVVAGVARDDVIVDLAVDIVIARAAAQHIRIVGAIDHVIARATVDRVHPVVRVAVGGEGVGRVLFVGDVEHVETQIGVVARIDRIVASAAEQAVVALAADDPVVAVTAVDDIVVDASVDHVIAGAAGDGVAVIAGADRVIARPAIDRVAVILWVGVGVKAQIVAVAFRVAQIGGEVIAAGGDHVITLTALDHVRACARLDDIIAVARQNCVVAVTRANIVVVAFGIGQDRVVIVDHVAIGVAGIGGVDQVCARCAVDIAVTGRTAVAHRHGHRAFVGQAVGVCHGIGDRRVTGEIVIGDKGDGAIVIDGHGAIITRRICHAQGVAVDIGVIVQNRDHDRIGAGGVGGIVIGDGGVVHRVHGDIHGAGVGAAIAVIHGIGDRGLAVEIRVRREGQRAIVIDDDRARRAGCHGDGQRVAIAVAVIAQHVDGARGIFVDLKHIVFGHGRVIAAALRLAIVENQIVDRARAFETHFETRHAIDVELNETLTAIAGGLHIMVLDHIAIVIVKDDTGAFPAGLFDVFEGHALHAHHVIEVKKQAAAAGVVVRVALVAVFGDDQQPLKRVGGQIAIAARGVAAVKDHRIAGAAAGRNRNAQVRIFVVNDGACAERIEIKCSNHCEIS